MGKHSNADKFCLNISAEEFLRIFNEMTAKKATRQEIADYFNISKYSLRKILEEKCNIKLSPGRQHTELKFKDE